MASILLTYFWLKLIDMQLFALFVVTCIRTSNIERKCLYMGMYSKYIHCK